MAGVNYYANETGDARSLGGHGHWELPEGILKMVSGCNCGFEQDLQPH